MPFLLLQVVLDVVALMAALERLEFPLSLQETVAGLFGLQDSVTLAELRAAVDVVSLPGRDLIRLRRALDPVVRGMFVCVHAVSECMQCVHVCHRGLECIVVVLFHGCVCGVVASAAAAVVRRQRAAEEAAKRKLLADEEVLNVGPHCAVDVIVLA